MTIDFSSKNFENPDIQSLYSHIQALALEEEEIEEPVDYLQQDVEGLKALEPLIDNFKRSLYGESGYQDPKEREKVIKMLKKRNKPAASKNPRKGKKATKSGKMEEEGDLTEQEVFDMEALIKDGKGSKLTKNELVKFLRKKGLSTQGKKADLVTRASKKLKTE